MTNESDALPAPASRLVPSWRRRAWWFAIVIVAFVGVMRLSSLRGVLVPVRIAGGSMAETLVGDHFRVMCDDCRFPFRCGNEGLSRDDAVVCPNCGFGKNRIATALAEPGQRVLVDRWPAWRQNWQRWDLVALRTPGAAEDFSVKRIVGLPGERIAIRHGDLWINDQRARRTFAQQKQLRTLVHDDNFRPQQTPDLPSRWLTDDLTGTASYQHWRCFLNPLPRTDQAVIVDNDAYSPHTSRALHAVSDLALTFHAELPTDAALVRVQFATGSGAAIVVEVRATQVSVWPITNAEPNLATSPASVSEHRFAARRTQLAADISVCDGELLVVINGAECLRRPIPPAAIDQPEHGVASPVPQRSPVLLKTSNAASGVQVHDRRIWRDVYYLTPNDVGDTWTRSQPLGRDEYFVLGDSPGVSRDSRDAGFGVVSAAALVGRVHPLP